MIRIAGVTLNNNKPILIALTSIYGIGLSQSHKILQQVNIAENVYLKDVEDNTINKLREIIEKQYRVESDLRREVLANIKRLKEIQCYRGNRHGKHLPVRGQRTKTNTRTVRGNVRRTMGSGRAKAASKT